MKSLTKAFPAVALMLALCISSCTENKTNSTTEEVEIKKMDSTAKAVKETADKLEDQTKKVEESMEKLDKEFKNNQ